MFLMISVLLTVTSEWDVWTREYRVRGMKATQHRGELMSSRFVHLSCSVLEAQKWRCALEEDSLSSQAHARPPFPCTTLVCCDYDQSFTFPYDLAVLALQMRHWMLAHYCMISLRSGLLASYHTYHTPLLRTAAYMALGYSITLTLAPKVFGGKLCLNFARTTPELPCALVTLPHMTLIFDPWRSFEAR